MYCSHCGTVNPEVANFCMKCGRSVDRPVNEARDEVEFSLVGSSTKSVYSAPPANLSSRILLLIGAVTTVFVVAVAFVTIQAGTGTTPTPQIVSPQPGTAVEGLPGAVTGTPMQGDRGESGFVSPVNALAVGRDVAKKADAARARVALEVHNAEYGLYPDTLADLDPADVGPILDDPDFTYTVIDGGRGFRLEL